MRRTYTVRSDSLEDPSVPLSAANISNFLYGVTDDAGVAVTARTALGYSIRSTANEEVDARMCLLWPSCKGTCTDITYTSMDIEVLGNTDGYNGLTYIIDSKLVDLFEYQDIVDWQTYQPDPGFFFSCAWQSEEIVQTHSGYSASYFIRTFITIGGKKVLPNGPANRLRVHVWMRAFAPTPIGSGLSGSWRFSKEMFIDDCSELLSPITLNLQSGGPTGPNPWGYFISGMKWNLNL